MKYYLFIVTVAVLTFFVSYPKGASFNPAKRDGKTAPEYYQKFQIS